MPRLPQGWTEEKLQNATVDDLRQLPEETLHELDQHVMRDHRAVSVIVTAQIAHDQRLRREELGLPPAPPKHGLFDLVDEKIPRAPDPFVELVERQGWDDFGYFLCRTDHTNDETWDQWNTGFIQLVNESIAKSSGGESVTDKCLIPIVDEPTVNFDSFATVQRFYNEVSKQSEGFTHGFDHGFCLAADADAIKSLLEPEDGVEPWLWLIDDDYDFTQLDSIADDEYPGHFPVAISSLIPDLLPMVGTGMSGEEVWACCDFDEANPVWTGAL